MVRSVKAGKLKWWSNVLWVLLALGLSYGVRSIPAGIFRPSIIAVASAFPVALLVVKGVVLLGAFLRDHISRKGKVNHREIDTEFVVKIGGLEIRWSYKARR